MARSVGIDRARIVAVAAELADAQGLEVVTLAAIAERLHVRIPSLYHHVAGLAGLRRELALLGTRELLEVLRTATVGKSGDDAVAALAQAYRAYATAHPGRYAATIAAPDPADDELMQVSNAIIGVVVAVLGHYRLPQEALIHAVRGLRTIAHGFVTLELAGGFGMPLDRDQSYRLLVQFITAGLASVSHAYRNVQE
jgi:AcrR family transcriptional regulator